MGNDDRKLGRGTAWVSVASGLSGTLDVVTTVTCMWLWRSTADLGTATLAAALLPVLERLASLGMPQAMVRQGDGDRRALSTMLWIGIAGSLGVLALVLAAGPAVAAVFDQPVIASLLIGFGIKMVLVNVHLVPEALLRRELRFDALTRVRIFASFADALTKLVLAILGAHAYPELRVWCFVLGPMVNSAVTSIGLQLCLPWRPSLVFDRAVARSALRYGLQVSVGELLYYAYSNADYLVIGRVWGEAAVGAYRLAYELVLDVVRLISLVTAEVAFPAFARVDGDRQAAADLLIRFTRQNAIALVPVVVFLAVAAGDLLAVLYPPMTAAATTAAQILCVVGALRVISFVLPAALAGLGHARDSLGYHILAAIILPAAFATAAVIFPDLGFVAVAWAWAAAYPVAFALLLGRTLDRCGIPLLAYLKQVTGIAACGAAAAAVSIAVEELLPLPPLAHLFVIATVILVVYASLLARVERITPRSILRAIRGLPEPPPPERMAS